MIKFLKFLIAVGVVVFRFYLIYSIVDLLIRFSNQKSQIIYEVGWYLTALLLDLYFVNLDNNLGPYIYNKKTDEQETNQ